MGLKEELAAIRDKQGNTQAGLEAGVKRCADAVTEALHVKSDEVALLLLSGSGNTLKFMWPPQLYKSRSVLPSTHKTAMAAVVLQTRKGKVDNKLNESFHLKFFENVKGMETSGLPIQKMVALPLLSGTSAIGVLEASRKGKTPEEAGPNFTPQDAQTLLLLAKEMAPGLAALLPENFF